MTVYEIRLIAVLGILAPGLLTLLVGLAAAGVARLVRRVRVPIVAGARALPSLRGDGASAAHVIDRRQAAWRLRC